MLNIDRPSLCIFLMENVALRGIIRLEVLAPGFEPGSTG